MRVGRRKAALVTGATGAIGLPLIEALLMEGYSVRALVRAALGSQMLPATVETVVGDIGDRRTLTRAVEDVDTVFHLAAKLHLLVHDAESSLRDDYERVNVDATRTLAEVSRRTGVRRLVYFSTIAVYGPSRPGEILNEASPPRPESVYAESKLRGEAAAMHAFDVVILRLAAVYGRRVKGNYQRLVRSIQRGRFMRLGRGTNRRTVVHQHDVARAAILAAEHAPSGGLYNVTDGEVHEVRDIVGAIAGALGRRLIPGYLPVTPARFVIGMIEDALLRTGRRPAIGRHLIDKLTEDVAVSGRRIQMELGFRSTFDLAAGWREALGPAMMRHLEPMAVGR